MSLPKIAVKQIKIANNPSWKQIGKGLFAQKVELELRVSLASRKKEATSYDIKKEKQIIVHQE